MTDRALGNPLGNPLGLARQSTLTRGEAVFPFPGNHQWVVPTGVFEICAVCVAAGGGGSFNGAGNNRVASGAGGGLAYKNKIKVTPGDILTVVVGAGGRGIDSNNSTGVQGQDGGDSYVADSTGSKLCHASGGKGGLIGSNVAGGTWLVGDGGGTGGAGTFQSTVSSGGGAAGYSGNGGQGRSSNTSLPGLGGTGGGGGSGGIFASSYYIAAGSGGVGLWGEGPSGSGGVTTGGELTAGGGGGSGGSAGSNADRYNLVGSAGLFGAGGSAALGGSTSYVSKAADGAGGGVRIVWGKGREFPSTDVGQS